MVLNAFRLGSHFIYLFSLPPPSFVCVCVYMCERLCNTQLASGHCKHVNNASRKIPPAESTPVPPACSWKQGVPGTGKGETSVGGDAQSHARPCFRQTWRKRRNSAPASRTRFFSGMPVDARYRVYTCRSRQDERERGGKTKEWRMVTDLGERIKTT